MGVVAVFNKDPDATLDYQIDWSEWLDGDTIITSAWTVSTGLTKETDSFTDIITEVWFSGGTDKTGYDAMNRITTGNGRTDDRTIRIKVKDK